MIDLPFPGPQRMAAESRSLPVKLWSLSPAGLWRAAGTLVAILCLLAGCRSARSGSAADFPAGEVPNSRGLVSAGWLKRMLDYQQSDTYRHQRFVVLEASWAALAKARDYREGHIPGAVHFNTDDLETGYPRWRLREGPELHGAIGRAGITPDTTVIVYGDKLIAAARVWWVLKYAGVADVRLLDGGMSAWRAAGGPVEREIHRPQPVLFSAPVATHLLATTAGVRAQLNSPRVWLADVRSEAEYAGRVSGYRYLDAKGRIPSAVFVGDGDDSAYLYKQRDGRLRPAAEILAHWRRQGLVPSDEPGRFERDVIFYCGGGWRSSVAFFYAWLLGFENIRNYSDGWSGWSTEYHPDKKARGGTPGWRQQPTGNPIKRGAP